MSIAEIGMSARPERGRDAARFRDSGEPNRQFLLAANRFYSPYSWDYWRVSLKGLILFTDWVSRPIRSHRATPAMHDDTIEPFWFPAVGRKKITSAFDGGCLTSDGGVMLLAAAERCIGIAHRRFDCRSAQSAAGDAQ
jgi:hypothetical protein